MFAGVLLIIDTLIEPFFIVTELYLLCIFRTCIASLSLVPVCVLVVAIHPCKFCIKFLS
jgi:hypothetical protein